MFIGKLKNDDLPAKLLNEGELEKQFVLPIVYKCLINTPSLHAYAHPWKQSTTCKPNCNEGRGIIESPLIYHGCLKCWASSKQWAAVNFFGHHCFDVIVGKQGQSIAVELKFLGRKKTNKKANDEFQRFIGQCTLAKLVHTRVIGFCVAEEGCLDFSKAEYISDLLEKGISVVIRKFVPKD